MSSLRSVQYLSPERSVPTVGHESLGTAKVHWRKAIGLQSDEMYKSGNKYFLSSEQCWNKSHGSHFRRVVGLLAFRKPENRNPRLRLMRINRGGWLPGFRYWRSDRLILVLICGVAICQILVNIPYLRRQRREVKHREYLTQIRYSHPAKPIFPLSHLCRRTWQAV